MEQDMLFSEKLILQIQNKGWFLFPQMPVWNKKFVEGINDLINGQFGEPQEARVASYSAIQTSCLPTWYTRYTHNKTWTNNC